MATQTQTSILKFQGDGTNTEYTLPNDWTADVYTTVTVPFVRRGTTTYFQNPNTFTLDLENHKLTWTGDVLNVGDFIVIARNTVRQQPSVFQPNQKHIEYALDNLGRQIKQISDKQDYVLHVDPTYTIDSEHKMSALDWLQTILRSKDLSIREWRIDVNGNVKYSRDDPDTLEADKTWYLIPNGNNISGIRQIHSTQPDRYALQYCVNGRWWTATTEGSGYHNDLLGRDGAACHPMSAITGLQTSLDAKPDKMEDFATAITISNKGVTQAEQNVLQSEIDTINATQNVVDIVATHTALEAYVTTPLQANDKIEVLVDETQANANTIYNWTGSAWALVGSKAPYYSKSETDSMLTHKQDSLPELIPGQYLTNNGTNISWAPVDALPSQAGNASKLLTTNGTAASWTSTPTLSGLTTTGTIQANVLKATQTLTVDNKAVEVSTNKVTTISPSSTDTQYPSAKCIYNIITTGLLPSQTGQAGKVLSTNGATPSWITRTTITLRRW